MRFRVVVVALACAVLAVAGCSKSDDKGKKDKAKPKAAIDAAKKPDKAKVDAAATPVKKTDAGDEKAGDDDDGDNKGGDNKGGDNKGGDKKLTNLKLLPKNWTFKQVKTFMKKTMNRGLGVKCDFCHEKDNWASDANKHKVLARKMMKMTQELNNKYFGGKQKLTCYSCHLGKEEPEHHH